MLKLRSKEVAPSEGDKDEPEIDDVDEVPVNLDLENCITKRKDPTSQSQIVGLDPVKWYSQ